VEVPVPDADLNDIDHESSSAGAKYEWRARLERVGARVNETRLPVRMLWGVRPDELPTTIIPGSTYFVTLRWQDLPSYEPSEGPATLSRADVWDPLLAKQQFYNVILELRNSNGVVAADTFLTSTGTDAHTFSVSAPSGVDGPFRWVAALRPVRDVSRDVFDSFEERATGATTNSTWPWTSYVYSEFNKAQWFAEGVYTNAASDGAQGAFIIVTNPATAGSYSGFGFYYTFGTNWALPADASKWADYTFSCDFKEQTGLSCLVELQLKDVRGGLMTLRKTYTPAANGWDTVSGSLADFMVAPHAPFFDSGRVNQLFVNVQMQRTNATYFATIDNVRFDGPEQIPIVRSQNDLHDSFEDRPGGDDVLHLRPWDVFTYSEMPVADMLFAAGVGAEATHGGQSAFIIVTNPASVGAYSGFLLIRPFAEVWSLPAEQASWTNYLFECDFKETSGRRCMLELQIKDTGGAVLHYTNVYTPGPDGWATVSARLDQFRKPVWVPGNFDAENVKELLVIVQMIDKPALYFGFIDDIRFFGPTSPPPLEPIRALYLSENDSGPDSDGDGIPDAYETGTGIFIGPTNTGTNPGLRDSDGDGAGDREELIAGTNPNSNVDVLRIETIARAGGQSTLSWMARSNRVYGVEFSDGALGTLPFCPMESLKGILSATNGMMRVVDPLPNGTGARHYRISVRQP
jgi:hypothetical protein